MGKTVKFMGEDCAVEYCTYAATGQIAIKLIHPSGEPMATATSCLDFPCEKDETFIKNYSENEGMLKALIEAGVVEDLGVSVDNGHERFPIVKVL